MKIPNKNVYRETMKTIKLEHHLAQMVHDGSKTATWRIYDDKNLAVNDEIELVDKVDPQQPGTWHVFANAVIDTIVEKRLGEIQEADFEGHETFESKEKMMATYRRYYGPQIDEQTPVKMIHFHLLSKSKSKSTTVDKESGSYQSLTEVKLYADGGSRGNPGPSASGYVLYDESDNIVVRNGIYLGVTTNNQAEYQALKLGLEQAIQQGIHTVHVYMDSMLVVNQMLGIFKVKNRDLWPIHDAAKQLVKQFKHISFTHVPRSMNKEADAEVNKALDEHIKRHG
jgi:ribonuclease HI